MPPKRKAVVDDISTNSLEVQTRDSSGAAVTPTGLPGKRQRVSRACDQCRAAREKCDGVQPVCFSCVSQNRPCTYQANPKKRGVQTGYIRTLEIALAWVFEKVSGSEEALNAVITHKGGQGHALLTGNASGGGERLHKRWRKSRVHQGIDRILSGASVPASPPPQDKCSPSPDISDVEPDSPRPSSHHQTIEGRSDDLLDIPLPPEEGLLGHDTPPSSSRGGPQQPPPIKDCRPPSRHSHQTHLPSNSGISHSTSSSLVKLPANHWRLLDIYFSYTHCWLPILGKQDIFQASYLYPDQGLGLDSKDPSSAPHAELWSALALAAFQDAASSNCTSLIGADNINNNTGALSAFDIYHIARSLIPLEDGPLQIHHSRALLLLSLVNLGRGNLTPAWMLVGSATRISLDISRRQAFDDGCTRQRMQSVLIACFIIDTIISARDDRPPHQKAEDMHDMFAVQEEGLDQWEPWTACEGFGASQQGNSVARSPAYCLSTFNHLYRILKLVSKETSLKGHRLPPPGQSAWLISGLRQAVNASSPFGVFISSGETGSSPVPTAYFIRIIYLWAAALLAPQAGPWLDLIRDTLHHYEGQFGLCSIPTIIPSCLAGLATAESYSSSFHLDKERLEELLSRYSVIWGNPEQIATIHPVSQTGWMPHQQPPVQNPTAHRQASVLVNPATIPLTALTSSSLWGNSALPTPRLSSRTGDAGSYNPSSTITNYQLSPSTTIPQNSQIDVQMQMQRGIIDGAISSTRMSQQRHGVTSVQSTDQASIDYDAILDDLASIDCADPVDVDPRFMANLGFAPGYDFNEILAREFGGTI